jgi:DNA topoisomerase-2
MATKPTTKASAKKKVVLEDEDSDDSMDVDERQDVSEIEDRGPSTSKLDPIQLAKKKKKTASETYTKVCAMSFIERFLIFSLSFLN